jgi:TatD DNase family protein
MLIDIHSHLNTKPESGIRIFNFEPEPSWAFNDLFPDNRDFLWLSAGIHPWHASEWNENDIKGLLKVFDVPQVLMVGEIGMDKKCSVPLSKQIEVFLAQAELADYLRKPVILHLVKAMQEIVEIKKKYINVPAWIVHGFRGGDKEAQQYIENGFYLSFGSRYRSDGLIACGDKDIFIETDESNESLNDIYMRIAEARNTDVKSLEDIVEDNFRKIFHEIKL